MQKLKKFINTDPFVIQEARKGANKEAVAYAEQNYANSVDYRLFLKMYKKLDLNTNYYTLKLKERVNFVEDWYYNYSEKGHREAAHFYLQKILTDNQPKTKTDEYYKYARKLEVMLSKKILEWEKENPVLQADKLFKK